MSPNVQITSHAAQRIQQRAGWLMGPRREKRNAEQVVADLCHAAIAAGRVSMEKPSGMGGADYPKTVTRKKVGPRTLTVVKRPRYLHLAPGVIGCAYLITCGKDRKWKVQTVIVNRAVANAARQAATLAA